MILRLALIDRKTLSGHLGGLFKKIGWAEPFLLGRKSEKMAKKKPLGTNGLISLVYPDKNICEKYDQFSGYSRT